MANVNTEPFLGGKITKPKQWANELKGKVKESDKRINDFLSSRENLIRRYVGNHYGGIKEQEKMKASPLNMVKMSANIYIPLMVMYSPRYRVRTEMQGHKGTAWLVEKDLNKTATEMQLRNVLEKATIDSIYMMGIIKTGFSHGVKVPLSQVIGPIPKGLEGLFDDEIEIPEVFLKHISPEDYIIDPYAKDQSEIQFEGDKYEVPLEVAREWFPEKDLEEDTQHRGDEGASDISNPKKGGDRLFGTIQLCDIYLPMYNVVHTFALNQPDKGILNEAEYEGDKGPYHKLYYHDVPDQVFPSAPAEAWVSLHDMLNDLARSVRQSAQRAKTLGVYGINAGEDGDRLQKARDGDFVGVQNPQAVNQIQLGGNTQQLEATLQRFMQIFSQQAGNTDLLGGMQAQARSATEAQMLGQNANLRVQYMQNKVEKFAGNIGETIAKLRWDDPFADRNLSYPVDMMGSHMELDVRYSPETKTGRFDDYDLEVVPYSMRGRNPDDYSRKLLEWWNQVVLPTADLAMQQGSHLDVQGMAKYIAEELGIKQADWFYRKGKATSPADKEGTGGRGSGASGNSGVTQPGGPDGQRESMNRRTKADASNMPSEIQEMMEHRESQ